MFDTVLFDFMHGDSANSTHTFSTERTKKDTISHKKAPELTPIQKDRYDKDDKDGSSKRWIDVIGIKYALLHRFESRGRFLNPYFYISRIAEGFIDNRS